MEFLIHGDRDFVRVARSGVGWQCDTVTNRVAGRAHRGKDKRWLGGPVYALAYIVPAVFGASLVTVFASFPEALIAAVAGIALVGPFVSAPGAGMIRDDQRFAAAVTVVVTASGLVVFGI